MSELVTEASRFSSARKAGHKRGIDEVIGNANTAIDDAFERFSVRIHHTYIYINASTYTRSRTCQVAAHHATWDTPSNITRVQALNGRKLIKIDTSVGGGMVKQPEMREQMERDGRRNGSIERTVERIQVRDF